MKCPDCGYGWADEPTKVYAVWNGSYEQTYIEDVFATRELAEASIEKDTQTLRRAWERSVAMAGTEQKGGAQIQQKQPDGTMVLVNKINRSPPPWEDYLRRHEKPWIEEYEVREP